MSTRSTTSETFPVGRWLRVGSKVKVEVHGVISVQTVERIENTRRSNNPKEGIEVPKINLDKFTKPCTAVVVCDKNWVCNDQILEVVQY